ESEAVLEQLLAMDALEVVVQACDVSVRQSVDACITSLQALTPQAVKGVLHAAGVLEDHLIGQLEFAHVRKVLAPKMEGALNLHASTTTTRSSEESSFTSDVELFVMFSSVAAMLGSPGQANYCAANTFLDAFALHRQAKGLPGLGVQWGPWADVGMAARGGVGQPDFWAPKLAPADGLRALSAVLASPAFGGGGGGGVPPTIGIARINWPVMLKRLPAVPPQLASFKHFWEQQQQQPPQELCRFLGGSSGSASIEPAVANTGAARPSFGLRPFGMRPTLPFASFGPLPLFSGGLAGEGGLRAPAGLSSMAGGSAALRSRLPDSSGVQGHNNNSNNNNSNNNHNNNNNDNNNNSEETAVNDCSRGSSSRGSSSRGSEASSEPGASDGDEPSE
ncbi:unnamed protein product, partial [Polarella glacialis]